MSSLNLELIAPSIHHGNNHYEKRDVSALAGHVVLSATSSTPLANVTEIHVRFIQLVISTTDSKSTQQILCPSFRILNKSPQPDSRIERTLREVALSIPSKEGVEISPGRAAFKSYFYLDIPTNIPATTKTPLGTITYAIEATATTSEHDIITRRRPLKLNHQMIQSDPTKTQHYLQFQASNTIRGMTLSQNSTPRSGPRISFAATIHIHWETAPAARTTELRHFVVRELKWQAEEIVKIMSKPDSPGENYSICERQLIRKLCDGRTEGYWGSGRNPYFKQLITQNAERQGGEQPATCIPFGFTISKRAMVVDDIDLAACEIGADRTGHTPQSGLPGDVSFSPQGKMAKAITVHHQLKVELITGEDVFHNATGKLVERQRVRTVVCPAIPLIVCEVSI